MLFIQEVETLEPNIQPTSRCQLRCRLWPLGERRTLRAGGAVRSRPHRAAPPGAETTEQWRFCAGRLMETPGAVDGCLEGGGSCAMRNAQRLARSGTLGRSQVRVYVCAHQALWRRARSRRVMERYTQFMYCA